MLYNLVLVRNKPYSNTLMAHIPDEVAKEWNKVFSDENFAKYGVKWVVYCDSAWCSEDYSVFAVNTYKDIPAPSLDTGWIDQCMARSPANDWGANPKRRG